MSSEVAAPPQPTAAESAPLHTRRVKVRTSFFAQGQPMVWLNGGALVVALSMILGLLVLILWQGLITFWPSPVVEVHTRAGARIMGEVTREEKYRPEESAFEVVPESERAAAKAVVEANGGASERRQFRTGNYELTNTHYTWVSDFMVVEETKPEWALVVERLEWGRFYGVPKAFLLDGKAVADDPTAVWATYNEYHNAVLARGRERLRIKQHDIGAVSRKQDQARLAIRQAELDHGKGSPEFVAAEVRSKEVEQWAAQENLRLTEELRRLDKENERYQMVLTTAGGQDKPLGLAEVVRAYPANQLSFGQKLGVYLSRWWEFLSDEPRESNTEGGVFPAIWGTVAMTLLMSLAVVPFGVLAALYLREYAKSGPIISAVRIAINNLAGVPSIVFGVFAMGFFCYGLGKIIDGHFYASSLPTPTFGTGGIMWASLTLALLTLPVVIVATEESLSAVPRSMREGSYACGASKWQTIRRIVLPRAMPGILTGMILAMARGAGEVAAPIMLVGALKLVPDLPVDGVFPFVHPQRSFMHLGFHIYDVGFQSPNSEAGKPMVFTTTLLLIVIIAALNLAAVLIRARLRRRFVTGAF